MYIFSLFLHITGAFIVFAAIGYAFFSIITNKAKTYLPLAYGLGLGLIVQVISGCAVELTSAHPALFLSFCSKILIYVLMIGITETALFFKMTKIQMIFPLRFAYTCLGLSGVFVFMTQILFR